MIKNIHKIAEKAGVSIATVSRALNNVYGVNPRTRKLVLSVATKMNYHPNVNAKRLVSKKTNVIGIVFPSNKNIFLDWYLTELLNDLQEMINSVNYDFLLFFPEEGKTDYRRYFLQGEVDGLIVGGINLLDSEIKLLYESNYPFLLLGSYTSDYNFNYVDLDNFKVIESGMKYLTGKGHTQIAAVLDSDEFSTGKDRRKALLKFVKDNNLTLPKEYFVCPKDDASDAYTQVLQLLQCNPRPTAVFAFNDTLAASVYRAAYNLKLKIPEDISVIGVNDLALTKILFFPPLTTLKIPKKEIVFRAVQSLLSLITGENKKLAPAVFQPELIERESVKGI